MKATPINTIMRSKAWLQFHATRISAGEIQVDYELILPLEETDIRGTFDNRAQKRPESFRSAWLDKDNRRHLPLGRSIIGTSNSIYPFNRYNEGEIDLPFRDGAHSYWDNEKLGLELYYITTDGAIYHLMPDNNPRLNQS